MCERAIMRLRGGAFKRIAGICVPWHRRSGNLEWAGRQRGDVGDANVWTFVIRKTCGTSIVEEPGRIGQARVAAHCREAEIGRKLHAVHIGRRQVEWLLNTMDGRLVIAPMQPRFRQAARFSWPWGKTLMKLLVKLWFAVVDCTTGRSAGSVPLRMRPVYTPVSPAKPSVALRRSSVIQ